MNDLVLTEQQQLLQASLLEVNDIVFKGYLEKLKDFDVIPLDTLLSESLSNIRLNKVTRIVYDKEENNQDKFNNVFSALHSSDCGLVIVLKGRKEYTDIYIGVNKLNASNGMSGHESDETLKAALNGNFKGIEFEKNLYSEDIQEIALEIKNTTNNYVSNVTGVPSFKHDDKDEFVQGLEKIVDGMQGREYNTVIQAMPITRQELEKAELAYLNIHNSLSLFEQKQITLSESESKTLGSNLTQGITTTLSKSIGETQTDTKGSSTTSSTSSSKTRSDIDIKKALSQGVSGAVAGGVAAGVSTGGMGAGAGALVGGLAGFGSGLFGGSQTESNSMSQTENYSTSQASSYNESNSVANSTTSGTNESSTLGTNKSIQLTEKNRTITSLLESIDEQLKRIQECKNYGMWNWGAYFISNDPLNSKLGADLYSGMLRGEASGLERNAITSWSRYEDENKFNEILNYVSQMRHPIFKTPEYFHTPFVSSTSLISTKELSIAMSLPQKSLPGIPVCESVQFGRAVSAYNTDKSAKSIDIGSIFNLGNIDSNLKVNLDINSLTSHTLVTGSTGSGKSNCIYMLLDKLQQKEKIPFLIVEPAKGEYKEIFGGRDDVSVFGTNPNFTQLLKLNPFSFPDNIHVLEHVDRLVEIFNACWPMYAAMPEVLKGAIIQSYEESGWDTDNSHSIYEDKRYPTFKLLLEVLDNIIESSQYSEEMKSNYKGALLTRVKSLNSGLIGKILNNTEEISDIELFDSNVIIDLSRVGSMETKSLLMGMIFLKLIEYRYSNKKSSNSELKHITVLEEAHNILPRISTDQSMEGNNLQGKSVEMISNAIAEMRTFGEGFIIADQSPNMLDMSAIRNTGTKIIMRLPELTDRNDIGKSASLNEEQINEIPKLQTGVGVVYQNNWLESVLCKIDKLDSSSVFPFNYVNSNSFEKKEKYLMTSLVKVIFQEDEEVFELEELKKFISKLNISLNTQNELLKIVSSTRDIKIGKNEKARLVSEILDGNRILSRLKKAIDMRDYDEQFSKLILEKIDSENLSLELKIKDVILYNESITTKGFEIFYNNWKNNRERIL